MHNAARQRFVVDLVITDSIVGSLICFYAFEKYNLLQRKLNAESEDF